MNLPLDFDSAAPWTRIVKIALTIAAVYAIAVVGLFVKGNFLGGAFLLSSQSTAIRKTINLRRINADERPFRAREVAEPALQRTGTSSLPFLSNQRSARHVIPSPARREEPAL